MPGPIDERDLIEDYQSLLRRGSVTRRLAVERHAAWRKAIRGAASRDELRVRTWSRTDERPEVWAVLPGWSLTSKEQAQWRQRADWLRQE